MEYEALKEILLSDEFNVSSPGLERIKNVLNALGNPQNSLRVINVAGTNGKGSVSTMLALMAGEQYKTGLFNSPYITELTEYIHVSDGGLSEIDRNDFAGVGSRLLEFLKTENLDLTHFEFITVLAILYFKKIGAELVVMEAGMGGREDATNVFEKPEALILTSMGMDHDSWLGKTMEEVISHKLGLGRRGEVLMSSDIICGGKDDITEIIKKTAGDYGLVIKGNSEAYSSVLKSSDGKSLHFDCEKYNDLVINTPALYQLKNAAAAVCAADYLGLPEQAIRAGLSKFALKARFEKVSDSPEVYIDGCHNPACAEELAKVLESIGKKFIIVTGVMKDKDIKGIYDRISDYAECFVCVDGTARALGTDTLAEFLASYGKRVVRAYTPELAVAYIRFINPDVPVLFAGTLYLTDRFREAFTATEADIEKAYDSAVERVTSRSFFSAGSSLPDLKRLLEEFDNPQDKLKVIHVAGTNGKGSTCAYIYTVLRSFGYSCGLFTSPYIISFDERIRLDGENCRHELFARIMAMINERQESLGINLNQFAMITAAAFIYYRLTDADYVVLETGLGGENDPTNICIKPECSVITNIGLDHTGVLGNTIEEIASAKAGIIKADVPVVVYPSCETAVSIFKNRAGQVGAPFVAVDEKDIVPGEESGSFTYKGRGFKTPLPGDFQYLNAAAAIEAVLNTESLGRNSNKNELFEACTAIKNVYWPGRLEKLSDEPLVYVDGGHNPQCIKNTTEFIRKNHKGKIVVAAGFLKDKDYPGMLKELAEFAGKTGAEIVCFPIDAHRALSYEELKEYVSGRYPEIKLFKSFEKGAEYAIKYGNTVLFIGSIYLINAVYQRIMDLKKET